MRPSLLVPVLMLAAPTLLPAQSLYLYAASGRGRTAANAYLLGNLADSQSITNDETWYDLAIDGPDRWMLRGDGKVALNGASIWDLADDDDWRALAVTDDGTFFALRKGGRVSSGTASVEPAVVVNYEAGSFDYTDILTDGTTVYVLRANGAVFRVPETDPLVKFDGPPGEIEGDEDDGEAKDTTWFRFHLDPTDGKVWALRGDGTLKSAVIPALAPAPGELDPGTSEADLPYDDGDEVIDQDELYADFTFDENGAWYALRADGKLYDATHQGPPEGALVDFPGEPSDDSDQEYQAVLAAGGATLVLRDDGKVYRDTETEALVDLKDDLWFGLALGTDFPNLDNVKNQAPFASCMTVTAPEGADVVLPVVAVDRDLPAEELLVTVDPELPLPSGATFDEPTRTISWPDAGPAGKYKVRILVDDGIAKPIKAVQTLVIKPLDDNGEKNLKPQKAKVSRARALVALPFALVVPAWDLDGDELTVTLDASGKPLPPGASYDGLAGEFSWDAPAVADKGSRKFQFLLDDGTVTVKSPLQVKVETSLLAF